jgi:hypothetical protein
VNTSTLAENICVEKDRWGYPVEALQVYRFPDGRPTGPHITNWSAGQVGYGHSHRTSFMVILAGTEGNPMVYSRPIMCSDSSPLPCMARGLLPCMAKGFGRSRFDGPIHSPIVFLACR